jgi:hypothetical protein
MSSSSSTSAFIALLIKAPNTWTLKVCVEILNGSAWPQITNHKKWFDPYSFTTVLSLSDFSGFETGY